jgi:hypothetical protein
VHRNADGTSLIRDGAGDGLTDPPCSVGGEAEAAVAVELFRSLDQADVALLNEIKEGKIMTDVLLGDGHHQTQICFAQAAAGVQAVAAGLEQLLTALLAQRAVLHGFHGLFLVCLFLGILGGLFAVLVQILVVAAAVLVLFKRETGAVLLDVLRCVVLLAVCLQNVRSLGTGMDAAAQFHLLLGAQQRDLTDLLEVVLHRVIQQLVHGSLQVCRVLLGILFVFIGKAHVIVVVLGVLHLSNDAVHVQTRLVLFLQDLDAALFQQGVEGIYIHAALCRQRLGLLCREGALALSQQFLQSHAHFFSPSRSGENCVILPCASDHKAAVHPEHLSGDVSGILAGQKDQQLCNFFRGAQPPHRGLLGQRRLVLGGKSRHHIGLDDPRRYAVHRDAAGTFFLGQCLGQADEPGFRGGIVHLTAAAGLAPHTAHGQNAALLAADHAGQRQLAQVERAAQVHVQHPLPLLRGDVGK